MTQRRLPVQPGVPRSFPKPNAPASADAEVASPHRAGHYSGLHPEDQPYQSEEIRAQRRATTRRPEPVPVDDEFEEEEDYEIDTGYDDAPRLPTSTRRYAPVQPAAPRTIMRVQHHSAIPPRASRTQEQQTAEPRTTEPQQRQRSGPRFHPLFYVGLGMLLVVGVGVVVLTVAQWWQVKQQDMQYGRPRTYQTDAVVGHDDSPQHPSHFIVLNLHGHTCIIEFPGGDAAKAKIYIGPILYDQGGDLTPVTIQFQDDGTGKPDMILHVGNQQFLYRNTGKTFTPPTP
jgi:hypothetical protein